MLLRLRFIIIIIHILILIIIMIQNTCKMDWELGPRTPKLVGRMLREVGASSNAVKKLQMGKE